MKEERNFVTNDKRYCPLLLACSMNGYLTYIRDFTQNGTVYLEFSPHEKARRLVDQFEVKIPLGIPEKDLFGATEFFWRKVYGAKNKL